LAASERVSNSIDPTEGKELLEAWHKSVQSSNFFAKKLDIGDRERGEKRERGRERERKRNQVIMAGITTVISPGKLKEITR